MTELLDTSELLATTLLEDAGAELEATELLDNTSELLATALLEDAGAELGATLLKLAAIDMAEELEATELDTTLKLTLETAALEEASELLATTLLEAAGAELGARLLELAAIDITEELETTELDTTLELTLEATALEGAVLLCVLGGGLLLPPDLPQPANTAVNIKKGKARLSNFIVSSCSQLKNGAIPPTTSFKHPFEVIRGMAPIKVN